MKKKFAVVAVALAAVLNVMGCGGEDKKDAVAQESGAKKISVGFSQIGAESNWRIANTQSIKDEAAKRGIDLKFADAQQKQENQIKALRSFISQGVDVISFSPVVESGWEPVLKEIKDAGIPVVLSDRAVNVSDKTLFKTFIGSDFVEEGRKAGEAMVKIAGENAFIVELQGTPGSAPAIDRKKGFEEVISKHSGIKIIQSQTGDFQRAKGKEVMDAFLKSAGGDKITAVFAHNDDMALGAIQAIEATGKKPGSDIKIVSIDGIKDAFTAMVEGKLNCTVECNPLIGPQLFDLIEQVKAGKEVPARVTVNEGVYFMDQAKSVIDSRKY